MVAAFAGDIENLSGFPVPVTLTNNLVEISVNRAAEDTASVTLITPVEGSIPLTWSTDVNMGSYVISQFNSAAQFTYVPNGVYSISVSCSLGTASSTMNAPGQITFNSNGSSVTATYPGNYDSAQVQETSPSPVTTYISATGVNVGSPFSYPGSAYASAPATYVATYSAALTVFSFTGTGSATGSFVGDQVNLSSFTR